MRTPISYYGGKQALLHIILPLIPEHEVYTEVFFGGGSVFFAKKPAGNETINDKLDICINFYKVLKNNFPELKKKVEETLLSRTLFNQAGAILKMNGEASPVDKAWAFWMRTTFAFSNKIGGGMKYSNDMSTSVPDTLVNKKNEFNKYIQKRIEHTYIENDDALKILRSRNVKKAFHYLDPPYFNADMGHYAGYTEENLEELLIFLSKECKGKFLLSNYASPLLDKYIKRNKWNEKRITTRLQAPKIKTRDKTETLVWNYNNTHQLSMY